MGRAVIVSWVTQDEPGSSTVVYWSQNNKKFKSTGRITTYKYYNYTSGFIHHCKIKNLEVGLRLGFQLFHIQSLNSKLHRLI